MYRSKNCSGRLYRLIFTLTVLVGVGCGNESPSRLALQGKVTLNDKAVDQGTITFLPRVDRSGNFGSGGGGSGGGGSGGGGSGGGGSGGGGSGGGGSGGGGSGPAVGSTVVDGQYAFTTANGPGPGSYRVELTMPAETRLSLDVASSNAANFDVANFDVANFDVANFDVANFDVGSTDEKPSGESNPTSKSEKRSQPTGQVARQVFRTEQSWSTRVEVSIDSSNQLNLSFSD